MKNNKSTPAKKYLTSLFAFVLIALLLRIIIAPQNSLESRGDTVLFELWGYSAHKNGLMNVYEHSVDHPMFFNVAKPNYLPPYMYVLWSLEWVHSQFEDFGKVLTSTASYVYKSPAMIFDILTVIFLAWLARKRFGDKWGLIVAGLYAFHPAIVFESAGWGQVDSINTFFMVLCVYLMTRKKYLWATAIFILAFFIKMQSLILFPLLFYEIVKNAPLKRLYQAFVVGLGTTALLGLPFFLAGKTAQVFSVIFTSPGAYKILSANAYNFWWLFSGGYWTTQADTQKILGVQLILVGALLFFVAVGFALWFRSKIKTESGLWLSAAFLAFAFFMLPTEMHERYLFPIFALLLPILPLLKKAKWLFGLLTITFTWNLIVVFIVLKEASSQRLADFWGGSFFIALANVLIFILTIIWYSQMAKKKEVT
ncbi:MAG: hypothetical protein WCT08_05160 [Patescibacteria group bacterium]